MKNNKIVILSLLIGILLFIGIFGSNNTATKHVAQSPTIHPTLSTTPSRNSMQPATIPVPAYSTDNSAGSSAQCNDGSQGESGFCVHPGV